MKNLNPEILSPVSDWEMCLAAIHGGANAIYIGAPHFNARGRAPDLDLADLKKIIDHCHHYGLRVFLALNILVFEKELQSLAEYLCELIHLGPDAFIVQDLGLLRLIRQIHPNQRIHASTQMTVSSVEGIQLLEDLRIERFVLAREMSIEQIRAVRASRSEELEVFVHGALCVAYSGQCLTSESFGGRSANRGQCAQSCRLDYELWVDGELKDLNGRKYIFSPKDLCSVDLIPELMKIGIESFKIEGRLKEPEYVASATSAYCTVRDSLDPRQVDIQALSNSFSRGFFSGWLNGVDHQSLVDGRTSSHIGDEMGVVHHTDAVAFWIQSKGSLRAGEGLWLGDSQGELGFGGRIYAIQPEGKLLRVQMSPEFPLMKIGKGWRVFRNDSPAIEKQIRQTWKNRECHRKIALSIEIEGRGDGPIILKVRTEDGTRIKRVSDFKLEWASKQPLTKELVHEELEALGDSPFRLTKLTYRIQEWTYVRRQSLRELKRQMLYELEKVRCPSGPDVDCSAVRFPDPSGIVSSIPKIHLLVRREGQIEHLKGLALESVTMDFEWGKDYRRGLAQIQELGFKAGIASLRIHKPGENHHLALMEKLRPDQVLVRNLGALQWFVGKEMDLVCDHGLNVCNSLAYEYFMSKGANRIVPSHDLSVSQLGDLLSQVGGTGFEVNLHHYMPTFHMEHCVFASFLSEGHSWRDCGKPCEKHKIEVRDHRGAKHFLRADQECRNTLFQGTPQSSAKIIHSHGGVQGLLDLGVNHFRIELLDEENETIRDKVMGYSALLNGDINSQELYERIGVLEKYGIAEGQLLQQQNWKNRKKNAKMS